MPIVIEGVTDSRGRVIDQSKVIQAEQEREADARQQQAADRFRRQQDAAEFEFTNQLSRAQGEAVQILANDAAAFERRLQAALALVRPLEEFITASAAVERVENMAASVLQPLMPRLSPVEQREALANVRQRAGVRGREYIGLPPRLTNAERVAAVVARLISSGDLGPGGVEFGDSFIKIDTSHGA